MKPYDENILYIIPARGGSKGIPRKNIKVLAGRPLIHYSIDIARQLANDDHIIVSTEDEEIAQIAQATGLPVPYRRPAELATDTTGSYEVILHAMDYADAQGIKYDKVCLLQPTSPLRIVDDVTACIDRYTPELDMVVTVAESRSNPYYNCLEADPETGYLSISKGHGMYTRRQDAPKVWEYTGSVYVFNPQSLRSTTLGAMKKRVGCPTPAERCVDLDNTTDWMMAETLLYQAKANAPKE